jgi:hypothetical protein
MNPKRVALWFLIVSVALSGVMGIIAILSGTFGDVQARIILTTLTISAASICALACGALWESGRAKLFPMAGILTAVLTACLYIFGIWSKISNVEFWKFAASVGLIAVATAHASLLSLAKLARRFAWTRKVAFVAVYILAIMFIYIMYFPPRADTSVRIIGVTSIVVAAFTILTPVFHRLSRGDLSASSSQTKTPVREMHATITCPRCGASLSNSHAETTCDHCGCTFLVTILDSTRTVTEPSHS